MYCRKCGKKIEDSAKFCPYCGEEVKSTKSAVIAAIVERLKNGDSTAFNELYEQTQDDIRSIARSYKSNIRDSEDVVQETYIKVYQKISTLNDTDAAWSWIKQIAHNTAKDYIKKNKKEVLTSEEDDDYIFENIEESDTLALPEDAMESKETQRLLGNMLDELPPMQKLVMIDFYFNEKKIKDIAADQELSEGTVKSYLAKGRKAMEEKLIAYQKKTGITLRTMPLAPVMLLVIRQSIQKTLGAAATSGVAAATAKTATAATTTSTTTTTATATTAKTATTVTAKTATATTAKTAAGAAAKVTAAKAVAGVAAVAVVGTGVAYEVHNRVVPVDPQAVEATLDEFTTACRDLDNEGILDCLSDESRKILEAYDITREYARTEEAGTTIEDQRWFELDYGEVEGNHQGNEASVYCEYVQYVLGTDGQKTNERTIASGYLGLVKEHGTWKIQLCRENENIFRKGSKTSNIRFPELIKNELIYNDEIE